MPNTSINEAPDLSIVSETELANEQEPSQWFINNLSTTAVSNLTNMEKNHPIQTYAFIDLETSGTNGTKITEFAVIAVSRYDLEKMQTRVKTSIPIGQPVKTPKNSNNIHGQFNVFSTSENTLPQNGSIDVVERVRRRLFAAASNETVESCSEIATPIQAENQSNGVGEASNGNVFKEVHVIQDVCDTSTMEMGHPSNKRPRDQDQEMLPSPTTADVATDTAGLVPRRWYSHYHKVPEFPRKMTKLTKLFNPKKLLYPDTEDVTGLNNFDLEHYPIITDGFCNAFKEIVLNLPKPVCLVAQYGEKYDFPIIVSEFLHATNCQFDWGDVLYADSLEVFKLLDKIETHLEIQEIQTTVDTHSNWFLDDNVFAVPSIPPKKRCTTRQPHQNENILHDVELNPNHSKLVEPQPLDCTSNPPGTPQRPRDNLDAGASQRTPEQVVMPSPLHPCPETPVTPTSQILGSWSIRNPSPSPCGSLITPPRTPVTNRFFGSRSIHNRRRALPSTSKPSLLSFPPNCSFKSMVQLAMNHKEYNLGFPKYIRPFSQSNLYHRIFGRSYDAHRAEADCQALLQIAGHYGVLFTKTVDILKRPMANIEPKMLTTRIVKNLKEKECRQ